MPKIASFSFAAGQDQDFDDWAMYDCRGLPDPEGLGVGPDGRDRLVQQYVCMNEHAKLMVQSAFVELQRGNNVAFGCHAGKNRSVSMAYYLKHIALGEGITVDVEHHGFIAWNEGESKPTKLILPGGFKEETQIRLV